MAIKGFQALTSSQVDGIPGQKAQIKATGKRIGGMKK
jgi:hypothetical protein